MKWTTISAIIGTVLLVTAFTLKLVGYEKVEAKEDVWFTIDSNEPFDSNDIDLRVEPNESSFTGIDITTCWERNYPIDVKLSGGEDLGEAVTFSLGGDHEIVCDSTRKKYLRILYESLSGKEPNRPVTLRYEEPELNEPNESNSFVGFAIGVKSLVPVTCFNCDREYQINENCVKMDFCCDCGQRIIVCGVTDKYPPEPNESAMKYSLPIPTWPDYIELEKELIVIWPKEILEGGWDYQPKITMSKGTKIYFKGDN